MKQYKVTGKLEVEFEGIVDAEDAVEAESKVVGIYKKMLNKTVKAEGRPYNVSVKVIM